MPHFKCVACKTRLHSPAGPARDLCPGCGSPLEPVGDLAEIVGFQSIAPSDRLDAESWLDDGDSFSPEALAEAMALPTSTEHPVNAAVSRPTHGP